MNHPDFVSGVTARLINKPPTDPVWDPPTLEQVTDEAVEQMFTPGEGSRLQLLSEEQRMKHDRFPQGLPREAKVEKAVREGGGGTAEEVVERLEREWGGRAGVVEKVREILERMCDVGEGGKLVWKEEKAVVRRLG